MVIKLTDETRNELKSLCKEIGITPPELVHAFLEDLTGTPGCGSDERDRARDWLNRHLFGNEFQW